MIFYLTAAFLTGYSSIIIQVILLRELLTVFYGNELCIGSILGLWLFGVCAGAFTGSRVPEKKARRLFPVLFLLMHGLFPVLLFLMRVSLPCFIHAKGEYLPFVSLIWMGILFLMPLSFQVGFTFPLACSAMKDSQLTSVSAGKIYLAEAAGSLLGGTLFTFILVTRLNYFQIGIGNLILAFLLVSLFLFHRNRLFLLTALAILLAGGLFIFWKSYPDKLNTLSLTARWNAFFSPFRLDTTTDTRYQNIALSRQNHQLDVYSNLKYTVSIPDLYSAELFAQFVLCESSKVNDILLIEGIFAGLIRPILSHHPENIDILELDKTYFDLIIPRIPRDIADELKNSKVSVHFADGRFYIKNMTPKKYDTIFVNVPDPDTAMLNRFYTLDFFREAQQVLSDTGILALRLTSSPNYLGEEIARYNASIYKTLKKVFAHVLVTPEETKIFLACNSDRVLTDDPAVLVERYRSRAIPESTFSPLVFIPFLNKERLEDVRRNLEAAAQTVRINTDSNPIAYHYNLYLWDRFSGSHLSPFLKKIEHISPKHIGFALIGLLLALLIPQFFVTHEKYDVPLFRIILFWAILSTGFTAMGMEILLLFAFQNIFGYLYSMIGFIVALFMCGLMLGAYSGISYIKKMSSVSSCIKLLLIIECIIPIVAFLIFPFIHWIQDIPSPTNIKINFFILVMVCGYLTGAEFPVAVHLFSGKDTKIGFSSGILDAADHLGAFLGAVCAGTFFLPLIGTQNTTFMIGLINVSSFILVSSARITRRLWQNR